MPAIMLWWILTGLSATSMSAASPSLLTEEFRWRGWVTGGNVVEINGLLGNVYAERTSGDEVEVVALKRGTSEANIDDVHIEVVEHDQGVTVCAVYPASDPAKPFECRPTAGGGFRVASSASDGSTKLLYLNGGGGEVNIGDVRVDFIVRIPSKMRFVGRTVEGDIELHNLDRDIEAHSVHGNVTVELPSKHSAVARLRTLAGSIQSDFPLRAEQGRFGSAASGNIGRGKRQLSVQTSEGSISITKAQVL